ncbi:hypothetical protein BKA66DRAFT_472170 [Pyrenochaeta sp. MPI-SDFR-AT-0127]|nr:hypothetical protein BKA66DRAFT_472170 [Pyrenochaeta sp. MPI-SDFR-AT-0127]
MKSAKTSAVILAFKTVLNSLFPSTNSVGPFDFIVLKYNLSSNMGQGHSQQQPEQRPTTPEPEVSPEERTRAQEEMRARQQAALDKRFASQPKKIAPTLTTVPQTTKKPTALEQISKENVGYRNLDAQTEFRRWD